jgi:hypothetical protein
MAYETALNLAWENLLKLNPPEVARCSEGEYELRNNRIIVDFLKDKFIVDLNQRQIFYNNLDTKSKNFISVLILHYLMGVKSIPFSSEKISFKDLPGGDFYLPAFRESCLAPLIKAFSDSPEALVESAKHFDGKKVPWGDTAVEVKPFKRFPLTVVFWGKDKEFSAEANILYEATAKEFLPTEDVVVVTNLTVSKLIKYRPLIS